MRSNNLGQNPDFQSWNFANLDIMNLDQNLDFETWIEYITKSDLNTE